MAASPRETPVYRVDQSTHHSWPKRLLSALDLPREHGAWAMLLVPYLVGTGVVDWGGWPSILLLLSIVLLFASSRPASVLLKELHSSTGGAAGTSWGLPEGEDARKRTLSAAARLSAYLGITGASAVYLLLGYQRWALVYIGAGATVALALQLMLRQFRLDRSWPARLLAIAALSTTGPAALYAATGNLGREAVAVWVLAFLYSGASVFYVRMVYRPPARGKPAAGSDGRAVAERNVLAYLAVAAAAIAVFTIAGWLPSLSIVALAPLALKVFWAALRRDYRPSLRQVGFAELGHSAIFAILAILVLRLPG